MSTVHAQRGDLEGRRAYAEGQSISDNPYPAHAYPYTDQGLACQGWRDGFIAAWKEERCPPARCPELANTAYAVLARTLEPSDGYHRFTHYATHIDYQRQGCEIGIRLLMTELGALGRGHARTAMWLFLQAAEAEGITVYLTPVATEPHVNKQQLTSFYRSLGFAKNPLREVEFWSADTISGHYAMRRTPARKNS